MVCPFNLTNGGRYRIIAHMYVEKEPRGNYKIYTPNQPPG